MMWAWRINAAILRHPLRMGTRMDDGPANSVMEY